MNRTARIAAVVSTIAASVVVVVGLVALAAPVVAPGLTQRVFGTDTIDTVPASVEDFLVQTDSGHYLADVSHEDVEEAYVQAASIWPWELPPGWAFPAQRGVADTPGHHWLGMGVRSAFHTWVEATLKAVEGGELGAADANRLLDDVEDATRMLIELDVLSDRSFIADSVTPLRP